MTRGLVALCLLLAVPAGAEPVRCRGAIAKASAKHAQAVAKVLQSCRERVRSGRLPPSADCRADPLLAAAAAKLADGIARQCCGGDGACGNGDDDSLAAIGWDGGACPDFANHGCTAPIADAGDVATCLACVGVSAADEILALLFGRFELVASGSPVARCQAAIGKETARAFRTGSKALQKCWDGRNRGQHANPCPDPGDGKAAATLARARALAVTRICAACGGGDGACGSGDDLAPGAIGAPEHCPAVQIPGAEACGGAIDSLEELVTCAGCVGAFAGRCADHAAVPAFVTYPAECNPPPPSCATGVECETSLDCPTGYECRDNGGGTRYCVGPTCTVDAECDGGAVCRQYCDTSGCDERVCQCPGFACFGPDELCLDDGGLACRKICTQDSDCTAPFGDVCVNPGFGFGVCIGSIPCQ